MGFPGFTAATSISRTNTTYRSYMAVVGLRVTIPAYAQPSKTSGPTASYDGTVEMASCPYPCPHPPGCCDGTISGRCADGTTGETCCQSKDKTQGTACPSGQGCCPSSQYPEQPICLQQSDTSCGCENDPNNQPK